MSLVFLPSSSTLRAGPADDDGRPCASLAAAVTANRVAQARGFLERAGAGRGALLEQSVDDDGNRVLHLAAGEGGSVAMVTLLLDAGADPAWRDANGGLPLHDAAAAGNADIVAQLCRRGPPDLVVAKDGNTGWTPLHHAASNGHLSVCALLVAELRKQRPMAADGGAALAAAIDARDRKGWRPLECAAANGERAVVDLLLSAVCGDGEKTAFTETDDGFLITADPRFSERLNATGAYSRKGDRVSMTCLQLAAKAGRTELCLHLLDDLGADIGAQETYHPQTAKEVLNELFGVRRFVRPSVLPLDVLLVVEAMMPLGYVKWRGLKYVEGPLAPGCRW